MQQMIKAEYIIGYHDGKTNDEDAVIGGGETEGGSILDLLFFHVSLERSAAVGRWHLEFAKAEEMGDYVAHEPKLKEFCRKLEKGEIIID